MSAGSKVTLDILPDAEALALGGFGSPVAEQRMRG